MDCSVVGECVWVGLFRLLDIDRAQEGALQVGCNEAVRSCGILLRVVDTDTRT